MFDRANQASPILGQLFKQFRLWTNRNSKQRSCKVFKWIRTGQHIRNEPAFRVCQSAPAECRNQSSFNNAGFATAARSNNCEESCLIAAFRQTTQHLFGHSSASKEILSIGFAEGVQAFI